MDDISLPWTPWPGEPAVASPLAQRETLPRAADKASGRSSVKFAIEVDEMNKPYPALESHCQDVVPRTVFNLRQNPLDNGVPRAL